MQSYLNVVNIKLNNKTLNTLNKGFFNNKWYHLLLYFLTLFYYYYLIS